MAKHYVIGVDIGTQGTRAALFSEKGLLVAEASESSCLLRPAPEVVEEDPERQVASVCRTIRNCIEQGKIDPACIAGIGIDGQMAGIIGLGKDGIAVTPYDSWLDTRCAPYITKMEVQAGDEVLAKTGNVPSINHGPKILWWKEEHPETFARITSLVQPSSYAAMRLCGLGSRHAFIDDTYLHFSGFANNAEGVWDKGLCSEFGVELDKLPHIASPAEIIGSITSEAANASGLLMGTPVVAGLGDTAASFLACAAVKPGNCADVAGTASVFAATVPRFAPDIISRTLACSRSAVPGLWQSYAYVNGGGLNLNWLINLLYDRETDLSETISKLDKSIINSEPHLDDPYFMPHMEGRVMPSDATMRGAWFGLTHNHGRTELYRSVIESIAFEYASYRDAVLCLNPGIKLTKLRATGGGSKSRAWNSMKAEILDMCVIPVKQGGGAPMGAALVAASGTGLVSDIASAACAWVTTGPEVQPTGLHADLYAKRLTKYKQLLKILSGFSDK